MARLKEGDPFRILGRGASIVKAVVSGVDFPIKDVNELIQKAGGRDRIIKVIETDGTIHVYSLMDLLKAVPWLKDLFPMKDIEEFVVKFAKKEQERRKERKVSPLLKIGNKHLLEIYSKLKVERRPIPVAPFLPALKEQPMSILLKGLQSPESIRFLKAGELIAWIEWIIRFIKSQSKEKALNAAAKAKQLANQVSAFKQKAEDGVKDVASAPTNTLAQQKVNEVCSNASKAVSIAQQVVNAATEACAHASSIPEDTEAQTACGEAQIAASSAQADANSALAACEKAKDIASISIVTICGKVVEYDPCCDDPWGGAHIEVRYPAYPEIPAKTAITDSNGNYCVTGRFGHSSRVGCSSILITVTMDGVSETKQITICGDSVPPQNFSIDLPGWE